MTPKPRPTPEGLPQAPRIWKSSELSNSLDPPTPFLVSNSPTAFGCVVSYKVTVSQSKNTFLEFVDVDIIPKRRFLTNTVIGVLAMVQVDWTNQ